MSLRLSSMLYLHFSLSSKLLIVFFTIIAQSSIFLQQSFPLLSKNLDSLPKSYRVLLCLWQDSLKELQLKVYYSLILAIPQPFLCNLDMHRAYFKKYVYPNKILHFIIPNLLRSYGESPFFSKIYDKMQLACCGSALLNALFSAFINYSREADAPPSKKPPFNIFDKLLFASAFPLIYLCSRLYF